MLTRGSLICVVALTVLLGCGPVLGGGAGSDSAGNQQDEPATPGPPLFAALGPGLGGNGAAVIIIDAEGRELQRIPTENEDAPWEEWSLSWYPDTGTFLVSENSSVLKAIDASTGEVREYGDGSVGLGGVARTAGLPDGGALIAHWSELHQTNASEEIVQTWAEEAGGDSWQDALAHQDEGTVLLKNGLEVRRFDDDERVGLFPEFVDSIGQDAGGGIWGADTFGGPIMVLEPEGGPLVLGEPADFGLGRRALAFEPSGEDTVWVLTSDGAAGGSSVSVISRRGAVTEVFETDEWWLDLALVPELEL